MAKTLPNTIVASLALDASPNDELRLTPLTRDELHQLIVEAEAFATEMDNGDVLCDHPQAMASYIFSKLSERSTRLQTTAISEGA